MTLDEYIKEESARTRKPRKQVIAKLAKRARVSAQSVNYFAKGLRVGLASTAERLSHATDDHVSVSQLMRAPTEIVEPTGRQVKPLVVRYPTERLFYRIDLYKREAGGKELWAASLAPIPEAGPTRKGEAPPAFVKREPRMGVLANGAGAIDALANMLAMAGIE